MKMLINLFNEKPMLGTATFFGGYGTALLSLLHYIPIVVGAVGAVAGGIAGIILLVSRLYDVGGMSGFWQKVKKWKNGNAPKV